MNQGQWIRKAKNHLNVIFIHGINSSEECWKHNNGSYWPDLLKDEGELADIGIYVFSYRTGLNTGSYSLSDVADSLREYFLLDDLNDSLGIIFVCHSMGGIIARRFLVKEQSDLIKRGLDKIGLFLVASPSLGSEYANMLGLISSAIGHIQASTLKFSRSNVWLNDLDKDFINLKSNGNLQIKGKELIEDLPLYGKGFIRKLIVEPFSGAKYFGNSFKVPGSDHCTIATPANREAVQNRLLVQFVKEFLKEFSTLSTPQSEVSTSTGMETETSVTPSNGANFDYLLEVTEHIPEIHKKLDELIDLTKYKQNKSEQTEQSGEDNVPDIPPDFNAFQIGNITLPVMICFGTPLEPITPEDICIKDNPNQFIEDFLPNEIKSVQDRLIEIVSQRFYLPNLRQWVEPNVRLKSFSQAPERDGDRRGLITLEFSRVLHRTLYITNLALDIPIILNDGNQKTIRQSYFSDNPDYTDLSRSCLANTGNVDVAVICLEDKYNPQIIIRKRKKEVSLYRGWHQVSATGYMNPAHENNEGMPSPFVTAVKEARQEIADSLDVHPTDFKLIGLAIRWIDLYPGFFGFIETDKPAKQLLGDTGRDLWEGGKSLLSFTPEHIMKHISENKWVAISALCAISTLFRYYPRERVEEAAKLVQDKHWRDFIEVNPE